MLIKEFLVSYPSSNALQAFSSNRKRIFFLQLGNGRLNLGMGGIVRTRSGFSE